jgi:hypothetical protein
MCCRFVRFFCAGKIFRGCLSEILITLRLSLNKKADGDLSFQVGDRIEIVERTASAEDWWTGRLNGEQGVFPGMSPCFPVNYELITRFHR